MVLGIWLAVADEVPLLWVLVIAFVVSGVASYFLLNRPRERFAQRVDERARRASAAFEERKAREDVDYGSGQLPLRTRLSRRSIRDVRLAGSLAISVTRFL